MKDAFFNKESLLCTVAGKTIPMLLVGPDATPYFRCNDAAKLLGYSNYHKAIGQHVRGHQVKTLDELLKGVSPVLGRSCSPDMNDRKTKYMKESGLYRLIGHSKLPLAEAFQYWVEEEVLPSIRKTGNYTLPGPTIQPAAKDGWAEKRAEGIELMRLKNATLQELIARVFGGIGDRVHNAVANHINQAVLGYIDSTKAYKRKHHMPQSVTIPDILNLQGQIARAYAEISFKEMIREDMEQLRKMREFELFHELKLMRNRLRQSFEMSGMGNLQDQVLSLEGAKARKQAKSDAKISVAASLPPAKKKKTLLPTKQQKLITCH